MRRKVYSGANAVNEEDPEEGRRRRRTVVMCNYMCPRLGRRDSLVCRSPRPNSAHNIHVERTKQG